MSKKYIKPLRRTFMNEYIPSVYLHDHLLWNLYTMGLLSDEEYETGNALSPDWMGTSEELIKASRKL